MFYTDVPILRADATRGGLAQTDPKTGKLVKVHEIDHCHPHSLALVADATLFLGCSLAPAPGGDLAVFDIGSGKAQATLPDMGGHEAFKLIREIRPSVPIIVSSGYGEVFAREELGRDAVVGFIQKPYVAAQLLETIQEALQHSAVR
jgi:DNA-binding NarL/FixJ family response regulator